MVGLPVEEAPDGLDVDVVVVFFVFAVARAHAVEALVVLPLDVLQGGEGAAGDVADVLEGVEERFGADVVEVVRESDVLHVEDVACIADFRHFFDGLDASSSLFSPG